MTVSTSMKSLSAKPLPRVWLHTPMPPEVDPDAPLPTSDPERVPDDDPASDPTQTPEGDPPARPQPLSAACGLTTELRSS